MNTLLVLVLVLWLLGVVGGGHARTGGLIHIILVLALVMFVLGRI